MYTSTQYTGVLTCLVLAEIVVVVYVYLRQDNVRCPVPETRAYTLFVAHPFQAYQVLESTLNEAIVEYYNDPDKASVIDNVQSEVCRWEWMLLECHLYVSVTDLVV